MAISTNGVMLTRLTGALYNQQLGAATYAEVLAGNSTAAALNTWANAAVAADFGSKTDLQVATTLITNVGLSSVAGLANWVAGQLTAGGVAKRGETIISLLNSYSNMDTTEAIYGASVATFNTKVDASQALSQTTGNTGGTYAAISTANTALTLTSAVQTSTGTAGDDTFTAAAGAWGTGDIVNGAAGSDTLNATVTGTAPTQSATSLVSIETLNLTASPNPATLDLTGVTGLTSVNNVSSANGASLTVSGLGNVVNTTITGGNATTSVAYTTAATVGLTDVATLSLKGAAVGSKFTTSGVETLTINSGTSANTLTTLTATGMTKLVITGDQALTIIDTVGNSGTTTPTTTYDASAATGAVTLTQTGSGLGTLAAGVTVTGPTAATAGAFTVTTGGFNDTVTLGANANTVLTGSGNDTITSGGGANTITPGAGNDTVNLGAGVDTVRFAEAGPTAADTVNTFGATDVIAVSLGTAATSTAVANATTGLLGIVQTGATTLTLPNVGGTGTGTAISFQSIAPNATASSGTVLAATNVVSLNGAYTDGTAAGVLTALGTSKDVGIATTPTGKFLLVTYSVGNIAQVWSYGGDGTGTGTVDTNIESGELSLIATLNGVALGGLTAANFATYLTPVAATSTVSNTGQTINLTGTLNTVLSTANTAGQFLTAGADTINVGVGTAPTAAASTTSGLTIIDPGTGDADVMNLSVLGDWALGSVISGIETINLTMLVAGTAFDASAKTPGTTLFNALGTQATGLIGGAVSGTAFGLGAGYTGNLSITPVTNPTAAYTLNLNGTAGTSAATSPTFTVGTGVVTALTINANAATTLNMDTNTTEVGTSTLNGSGNVTIFDTSANFATANIVAVSPAYTGTLTFRPSTSTTAMDFTATGVVTGLGGINYSDVAADAVDTETVTVSAATSGGNSITITDDPAAARDSSIQNFTLVQAGTSLADSATFTFGAKTTPALTGAITAATTETVTINYSPTTALTAFSVVNITTAAALGTQTVNINGTGAFALGTVTADNLTTTGVGSTGSVSATLANGSSGAIFTGGAGPATIIGSTSGDLFTGGAGADSFRTTASGAAVTSTDRMTGGQGNDTFILSGSTTAGALVAVAPELAYTSVPNITDFSISGTNGVDILSLSATAANYSGGAGAATALALSIAAATAVAAGASVIASIATAGGASILTAAGNTTANPGSTMDLIKFTTVVAGATSMQGMFNSAIGNGTITGLQAGDEMFFVMFDSTNLKMVVGSVDAADTAIATADVVNIIGTVDMTAANYALFGTANFSLTGA